MEDRIIKNLKIRTIDIKGINVFEAFKCYQTGNILYLEWDNDDIYTYTLYGSPFAGYICNYQNKKNFEIKNIVAKIKDVKIKKIDIFLKIELLNVKLKEKYEKLSDDEIGLDILVDNINGLEVENPFPSSVSDISRSRTIKNSVIIKGIWLNDSGKNNIHYREKLKFRK